MESLRIYFLTWNVACKMPEENVGEMLGLKDNDTNAKLPDFYVIGLQEVKSQLQNVVLDALFDDPWTRTYKDKLQKHNYVKIKTIRLQGILLSFYSKRKHLSHIRDVEVQFTKTGFGGFWGNKGAVAIRLSVYGVSMCLVNTHLTPHDQNLNDRIDNYNIIIKETTFKQKETSNILFHDYIFWIGDQNFRIDEELSNEEILSRLKDKKLKELLNRDQLKMVRETGLAFSEMSEEPITFKPTYKYLFNSFDYDSKRRPAWTDRILYKVNAHVYENITLEARMVGYNSFDNYVQSDHKPVYGEFLFKVMADYCEKVVEFGDIKQWVISEENKVSVIAGEDVKISNWDWIGVFKKNFSALDEYLSFVYVSQTAFGTTPRPPSPASEALPNNTYDNSCSSSSSSSRNKEVTFPEGMIRVPGEYCLLYFTADSGSVLGISPVFQAQFKPGVKRYSFPLTDTLD